MKLEGAVTLKGVFDFELRDKEGNLKDRWSVNNTITNTGKAQAALLIQGNATTKWTKLAIGSGSTAAAAADTTLGTEITSPSLKRIVATASQVTTTVTNDSSRLVHTFSSTATQAVSEVGIFDTPTSGGTMLSRKTFTTKNLTSGDTLQVTHTLTVA